MTGFPDLKINRYGAFELHDDPSRIRLSEAHSAYQWISEGEVQHYLLSEETKDSILRGFHLSG
ncbi:MULTISPECIES: hypothetical protein [Thermoactinomyces]|uniref:Uncharacterized protein n=1 Tax=Thermoactinomyces vulgaris TaxID=2026 RepID=A0ABS0QEY5_THEVU|nr:MULTISPECIES: hypothetical protein [Thermoactinomyces]KFZ41344.1 hypothetical protein JS81_01485 [Thermoactinomyces sp. Gus2-1]KYQ87473.1 hypothetical protein AYX07_01900 [Thermoactinomyces sp. AS95]MBA4551367.1 hypothetical protein [Thermoactinomyces vulgaris]MBA4595423.1 hypothetical protein [Thermoactinomyces vulgaris]MBH8583912.1 hypothetical protein [Thermoactinomyces sp. CICC 10735]